MPGSLFHITKHPAANFLAILIQNRDGITTDHRGQAVERKFSVCIHGPGLVNIIAIRPSNPHQHRAQRGEISAANNNFIGGIWGGRHGYPRTGGQTGLLITRLIAKKQIRNKF